MFVIKDISFKIFYTYFTGAKLFCEIKGEQRAESYLLALSGCILGELAVLLAHE